MSDGSADTRLGAFDALTYGVKFAVKLDTRLDQPGSEINMRVEYYQQTLDNRVPGPGALQGLDLYPSLKATLVQMGYSY